MQRPMGEFYDDIQSSLHIVWFFVIWTNIFFCYLYIFLLYICRCSVNDDVALSRGVICSTLGWFPYGGFNKSFLWSHILLIILPNFSYSLLLKSGLAICFVVLRCFHFFMASPFLLIWNMGHFNKKCSKSSSSCEHNLQVLS